MRATDFLTEGLKDRVQVLIDAFKQENPEVKLVVSNPSHVTWVSGYGGRYRDPGYISGDAAVLNQFWEWLGGLKTTRHLENKVRVHRGNFQPALIAKGVLLHKGENSIGYGSPSRLKNQMYWEDKENVESQVDDSTTKPELEEEPVMIPPLQQALEIEKAKLNPDRAKRFKALRQLLDKAKTQHLPNQPK